MLCITILNSLKNATYSKGYGHYFTPSFNVTFHSKTWNKWATPNFVCFWVYACVCIQVLMTGGGSGGSRAQVQNLAFWLLGKQVLDIPVSVSCLWIGQDTHCISLASLRIKKKKHNKRYRAHHHLAHWEALSLCLPGSLTLYYSRQSRSIFQNSASNPKNKVFRGHMQIKH